MRRPSLAVSQPMIMEPAALHIRPRETSFAAVIISIPKEVSMGYWLELYTLVPTEIQKPSNATPKNTGVRKALPDGMAA